MAKLIFITGGVRSGKSKYAVNLAKNLSKNLSGDVVFLATALSFDDLEMKRRIQVHQNNRPSHWKTIEEGMNIAPLLSQLNSPQRVIIIDCLTLLISNLLLNNVKEEDIIKQIEKIADFAGKFNQTTIVVSNEVGWGIVPETPLGRKFRDLSGIANQVMAKKAQEVWLTVCGIPVRIK